MNERKDCVPSTRVDCTFIFFLSRFLRFLFLVFTSQRLSTAAAAAAAAPGASVCVECAFILLHSTSVVWNINLCARRE